MSKNKESRDFRDGIEDLMNTFGENSDGRKADSDAVEIDKVIIATKDLDDSEGVVNVDELLDADANRADEDTAVAVDELEAFASKLEKKSTENKKSESAKKKNGKNNKNSGNNSSKKPNKAKGGNQNKNTAKKIEEPSHQMQEVKTFSPARLVITLAAICAAVALLLGAVNLLTESQIDENNRKATLDSIRKIFDATVEVEDLEVPAGSGIDSAYLVMKNGCICGYSATVAPNGFGGPINLMVGMNYDGTVVGVDVISMAETPGLGSRVSGQDFLSQFKNTTGEVKADVISGASISSRAVISGVNTVTANLIDLQTIAHDKGMSIIPFKAEAAPVITESTKADDDAVVPTPPETEPPVDTEKGQPAPDVSKNDSPPDVIVPSPGNGGGVNAEYVSDTTEYETLTTEPESTEPETSVSGESETETEKE